MLPVASGRHQVWAKKLGAEPVKVLLLPGGPAFTHAYSEATESFPPQARIEMYYQLHWDVETPIPRRPVTLDAPNRSFS
jgi:hypothetical protein